MSNTIMILGESGSGKTISIRNLDPKETILISIGGRMLPSKGCTQSYSVENKNYKDLSSVPPKDCSKEVLRSLTNISNNLPNIKTVVVDDSHFIMVNEFFNRASEVGFNKFTQIGQKFWDMIEGSKRLRSDLNVYFLHHSELKDDGIIKAKTIGKMLDQHATLDGKFDLVLHAIAKSGKYNFYTNCYENYLAHTPMGMFKERLIDNDMSLVNKSIEEYLSVGE